jgi:hypothetical protein
MFILKRIYKKLQFEYNKIRIRNHTKFFCIGANKTGTTSLEKAFKELGFVLGNQRKAELLSIDCFEKNYQPLLNYCKTAEVFQDVPFAFLDIYKVLDQHFPNSKFILSIRDSPEQWYQSLTKFHAKIFGNGSVPTWEILKNTDYVYKGWVYKIRKTVQGLNENDDPYDKTKLINYYEKRNQEIITYFKNRPNDLLVINLSEPDAYQKFCNFIGVKSDKNEFPWENKTENIKK